MIRQIQLIQILFFTFSFVTLFSQGVTNNIFAWRLSNTSLSLILLLLNMICFIFGKIYGNIFNHITLRLISYICFLQAFLSIFVIPEIIILNCPFIFIKSFLSGILSSVVFSLMSNKTEKWRIKKYPIQICIFIGITLVSNILVYILSRFNTYVTIICDGATGYILYKISSNDLNIQQIIEDKDKLTDMKSIFDAFLNNINSIIIFIIQKKREFVILQLIYIIKILAVIAFIILIGRDTFFQNKTTYYYLAVQFLKKINQYIKNETLHHHIEEIYSKLEFKMVYYSTDNKIARINILKKEV